MESIQECSIFVLQKQTDITTKKELIAALKSTKKLYGYVKYCENDGAYFQMVKSDFLEAVLEMDDDTDFSNIIIGDRKIHIN